MPFHRDRIPSYVLPPDYASPLAQRFTIGGSDPDSKFLALHKNDEALALRCALIEQATQSIDAQYYSWHADTSGQWLISKLIEAADRGVRVRLLLDDIQLLGSDRRIATLNGHKNIEVRIFNPFMTRWQVRLFWVFDLLWNLNRLNRRMHNKVLIADNVAAIIGGRNIGDEYFGLNPSFNFQDLDLLVAGSEVEKLSSSFDLFWNNNHSKSARRLIAFRPRRLDFRHLKKRLKKNSVRSKQIFNRIDKLKGKLLTNPEFQNKLINSKAKMFYDLPDTDPVEEQNMAHELYQCNMHTKNQLTIISAYFIPSKELLKSLQSLLDNGVHIQVLTNSLASIDVTAAFAGYERYRTQLLNMGIELFEFRPEAEQHNISAASFVNSNYISLHAKSIIYDDESVYIGSLNLDPRSEKLNTEIGLFINNAELTDSVYRVFIDDLKQGKYWQVKFNDQSKLIWQCGHEIIYTQPARSFWQRLAKSIYSLLPIQQHL